MTTLRTPKFLDRRSFLLLALLTLLWPVGGCDADDDGIVVMTQNVYYGFDTDPLLSAQNPDDIPVLAAQAFQQLLSTDFPERARAIAGEIARKRPHLIGLQEVALLRIQSPGDAVQGGAVPAETVLYDYLEILLHALRMRGLDYQVAGKVQNVDIELPMIVGTSPLAFDDVRLTDFDVILARRDVQVSNVSAQRYLATLPVPSLGLEIPRGYVAVDATIRNQTIRFATTHLEDTPFPEVQLAQARELAAALTSETKPLILVGDFNSPAPAGGVCPFLASQGFLDAWTRNVRKDQGAGLTWGHDPDLRNPNDQFTVRLDLVWVRDAGNARRLRDLQVSAETWGDRLQDRTSSGLWPSDHAAVLATLKLPAADLEAAAGSGR
jgi:endonuclease/exonuclease/phosphatase family metal-dependent hydrolase